MAKHLAAAKLPSAPSPECIGGRAVEGSGNTPHTSETTDHTENALGGVVAKKPAAGNNSSHLNKWKTLDIVELTDSEFAADEGENSSDSTGSTKTQCKKKKQKPGRLFESMQIATLMDLLKNQRL
ncbi:hypothetical protein JB92DRAFT_2829106 [Gautieria morchelliformis]|nr:hypothetical protein JB92DRAFT_2829106 [Gautieria morchelliformis]